jgi:hypothetical protein
MISCRHGLPPSLGRVRQAGLPVRHPAEACPRPRAGKEHPVTIVAEHPVPAGGDVVFGRNRTPARPTRPDGRSSCSSAGNKQHLRIRHFFGHSENAVHLKAAAAIVVYLTLGLVHAAARTTKAAHAFIATLFHRLYFVELSSGSAHRQGRPWWPSPGSASPASTWSSSWTRPAGTAPGNCRCQG